MVYLIIMLAIVTGYVYFINSQIFNLNLSLQEELESLTNLYATNINKLNKEYVILTISSLHTIHYLLSLLMEENKDQDYFEVYTKFFNDIVDRETKKYDKGR
jgi:hypothetical protein